MDKLTLILLGILSAGYLSGQSLRLAEIFTDHAVLQRNVDHPLSGWSGPGAKVTVDFAGTSLRAKTAKDGRWTVTLPATPAGGPHEITVRSGRETVTLTDLYFGDVYLLSGQSNMEWRLEQSDPTGERARTIADPLIRQILVEKTAAGSPLDHLTIQQPWTPGTATAIGRFSGVGAYFAHHLRSKFGVTVPIGLVHSSWGGSKIEAWIEATAQGMDAAEVLQQQESMVERMGRAAYARYAEEFGGTPPVRDEGEALGYLKDGHADASWGSMELPGTWESRGYPNVDGVVYFRRTLELTAEQAAGAATLLLGGIDDEDETYVNGRRIGGMTVYNEPRNYELAAGTLRPGSNTIAIRVVDNGWGGGFTAGPERFLLRTAAGDLPLAGPWKFHFGEWRIDGQKNHQPMALYNAMIAPLAGLPLSGVLWYQGESNTGPGEAEVYADQMRTLIRSWRDHFDRPDLPFYWVQLANYQAEPATPDEPGWAVLRAAQTAALDLPNTGQAVITDLGEADDIHPQNKWDVGYRLALHAAAGIYGKSVTPASVRVAGAAQGSGEIRLAFRNMNGRNLVVRPRPDDKYGYVRGFTVRDAGGEWHWSRAYLSQDGQSVTLPGEISGKLVTHVRYAWANNPAAANVYSSDGLPLTPFEIEVK